MALTAAVPEEQKLYARWLSLGARAGLGVLSACFLVYVLELLEPQVPLHELPALWAHPVDDFRALTGAPAGWGWIALLGKGDYLSFVGIVMLGLVTVVCYARIVPALLKRGEWLQAALAAAQVLVLLAAASGLLASPARADEAALKRAQQIVSGRCFLCHGAQGESASELYPRLAGQNPVYIAKQLANFASGERRSTAMQPMAADLTPQERSALGLYFSRQKSEPHPASDPQLAAQRRDALRGSVHRVPRRTRARLGDPAAPRGPDRLLSGRAAAQLRRARPHQRQRGDAGHRGADDRAGHPRRRRRT